MRRCDWCLGDELYIKYHDEEWGRPVHDDITLFEFIILEGAQAGLSWITILKRRENYRIAFDNFDPNIVANYDEDKINELMNNKGIIRNKRKIHSAVANAKAFLEIEREFGSFDKYIWSFTDGKTIKNEFKELSEVPAKTELSEKISKALKKRGFNFVGPTIIYSYLQAVGIINDHLVDCHAYNKV